MQFTFKKEETFKTCVGKFFTLITVGLIISFVSIRMIKLVTKEDPLVSMLTIDAIDSEIDLLQLGFMFAIQAPNTKIGRVIAN